MSERGHPVRLSAQREQPLNRSLRRKLERALPAGGQDVRAPRAIYDLPFTLYYHRFPIEMLL